MIFWIQKLTFYNLWNLIDKILQNQIKYILKKMQSNQQLVFQKIKMKNKRYKYKKLAFVKWWEARFKPNKVSLQLRTE